MPFALLKEQIISAREWPIKDDIEIEFVGQTMSGSSTLDELGVQDEAVIEVRITGKLETIPGRCEKVSVL